MSNSFSVAVDRKRHCHVRICIICCVLWRISMVNTEVLKSATKCTTPVEEIFGGVTVTTVICRDCKTVRKASLKPCACCTDTNDNVATYITTYLIPIHKY